MSGPVFEDEATEFERRHWLNVVANLPILERAESSTVETLLEHATFRRHAPHSCIYAEGDRAENVYFLIAGTARVYQANGRSQYSPKIFVAPTHFGDLAGLAQFGAYRSSIEAVTAVVSARVPFELVMRALEEDHGLCLAWLLSVSRQHALTIDSDRQSVFGGLFARFANIFLSYADAFGAEDQDMTAIDHALSYSKLAQHVGCTRRRAIAVVQQMAKRGFVQSTRDGWRVRADRLKEALAPGRLGLVYSLGDGRARDDE